MREFLTPADSANGIRMNRSLHSGAFLIVEGYTDLRFYKKFIDDTNCSLMPAFGKNNAIKTLEILEADGFEGVLVIVDADFWKFDGIDPGSPNIILTDTYDLESMLICSNALDKVLNDFGEHRKMNGMLKPIRDLLLEVTPPIGFFRWLSFHKISASNLNFKGLPFPKFIDRKSLIINIDDLIEELKNNSKHFKLNEDELKIKMEKLMKRGYDPQQVCSGCDMINILTVGLRHIFGKRRARSMTPEILEGVLRVAYDDTCFCSALLYDSVKQWENMNPSFRVLK